MKKIFKNSSGNIEVRESTGIGACGIVNMFQNGCVIGYWKVNKVDGEDFPEFISFRDRFIETEYDFDIFKALNFGQKLAEILIETKNEK